MTELAHPGLLLIVAGVALSALNGRARDALTLLAPAAAIAVVLTVPDGVAWRGSFMGYAIVPYAVDPLSRLFALAFAIVAFGGGLFALRQQSRVEVPAAFVYGGSAIGVAFAGDLISVFACWEAMALASTVLIWSARTEASYRASLRYLAIHLLGGVVLMAGIAGHVVETGSTALARVAPDSVAHWLMLAGFLLNAGAPPLSAWVADAYPEASWSGTVFLSAFTTKAAVYVLLRAYPGTELLVPLGLVMIAYGVVYAVLENDMRRLVAYAIVNQSGFMLVGIGIGTSTSLNGAAAQAFTGMLYVALLLMAAGAVLAQTGRRRFTDLGGLARSMPVTAACAVVGAMSIAGLPLTAGFVAKSMIAQAALDEHRGVVWLLLTAGSAAAVLHAGGRFVWLAFFHRDAGLRPPEPPPSQRLAMLVFAALCVGLGVFYAPLYALLPFPTGYAPYTAAHVVEMVQLLAFGGAAFFVLLPALAPARTITIDTDWLYRRLGPALFVALRAVVVRVDRAIRRSATAALGAGLAEAARSLGERGRVARTFSTGSMALWVSILLVFYLALYYL